ncbi:MAG: UDP-N-acetylmuramoyl-L-alanyl-D-glutamate--2,6-diaminopimelate ligase [Gammaproteobacteria bacterium]
MMPAARQPVSILLSELLTLVGSSEVPAIPVEGLALDSRLVQSGDVFFAVAGSRAHGLHFAEQAIDKGAVAIVWESSGFDLSDIDNLIPMLDKKYNIPLIPVRDLGAKLSRIAGIYYGQPSAELNCIGVTGTDGKTSVSHFIAQALHSEISPCGVLGTLGYGIHGQLVDPSHTTPDPIRVQAELLNLQKAGAEVVAMEVSSHALDQYRVASVQFDTVVLTNISRDHLDYHGSLAAYVEVKRQLFRFPHVRHAVLNLDDALGLSLIDSIDRDVSKIGYSIDPDFCWRLFENDLRWLHAAQIDTTTCGLEISLLSSWGEARFHSALLGEFNVANMLATAAALLASGIEFESVVARLQGLTTVAGRMESFGGGEQPLVVVDYAHTPNALQTVLRALRPHCPRDLLCVFGAGGNRDRGKRPLMGAVAEAGADRLILTNDNPREEDPQAIIRDILAGVRDQQVIACIPDRAEAIHSAIGQAKAGDVVLIAGKGHEDCQIVGEIKSAFSDRDQVKTALQAWQT